MVRLVSQCPCKLLQTDSMWLSSVCSRHLLARTAVKNLLCAHLLMYTRPQADSHCVLQGDTHLLYAHASSYLMHISADLVNQTSGHLMKVKSDLYSPFSLLSSALQLLNSHLIHQPDTPSVCCVLGSRWTLVYQSLQSETRETFPQVQFMFYP